MNGRRLIRLVCIGLCNGFLFAFAARGVRNVVSNHHPEDIVFGVSCVIVCVTSVVGVALEILKRKIAAAINVATPIFAALVMATSVLWLPMLAARQENGNPGEAGEGAAYLLLFSLIPICLALIIGVLYRALDVEPDRDSITLGLGS